MRLLLDTHALLWWLAGDPELSEPALAAIRAPETDVAVSAASAWEIAIKKALGKLEAPDDLLAQLERNRFSCLAITAAHALLASALPPHHHDPFDRMLVAQAQMEKLVLVTRDSRLPLYGVPTLPA